jgi:putative DNA primase/helicase
VAALTILRAFHVAGRPVPEGVSPLGSFEDWSLLVRNALIWLGCADPVPSQKNLRKDDPQKARLEDVVEQWWDVFEGVKITVAEVIIAACEQESTMYGSGKFTRPLFRDALLAVAGRGGAVNSRALGEWLSGNKGRIAGGFRFEIDEKKQRGAAVWQLVKAQMEDAC